MAKTPEERRLRRQQLENEFIDNIEQILGFNVMGWQKPLILAVRRASLEGQSIDVKTMVENERNRV